MDQDNTIKNWGRLLSLRRLSIKQRLLLLTCVLLLSVIITGGVVSYLKVKNDALATGGDHLLSSGDQLSTFLGQSSQNLITTNRALAMKEPVQKYLQTKDTASQAVVLNEFKNLQDTTTVLIELLDKNLQVILSSGKPGIEKSVGFAVLTLSDTQPDTSRVGKFYQVNDKMYFNIISGVLVNDNLIGYLVRWRRVSNNPRMIEQMIKLMGLKDAHVYFGNSDNNFWTEMGRPVSNPVPPSASEKNNILSYKNEKNEPVIAVRKPVRFTHWQLLIEESQHTIMQPARNFLKQLILIGSILLVVGIFWAWLMSRNITQPLNKLTAATSVIASGDYSMTVAEDRNDEVGKLAKAFNAMIGQISKTRERLEQKVIEVQNANEQLRDLSAHLQNIREEERIHIAREMHDELGQLLTGFKMDISWLKKRLSEKNDPLLRERLEAMTFLVDESVKFVRELAAELRPSILDDLGLIPALEWHSREFEKRYNIQVNFHTQLKELTTSSLIGTGLFRMYQESLTNVARHSDAKQVVADLGVLNGELSLTITDDGKGFDIQQVNKKTLGLLGMKERAAMIGGNLEIISEPGKGTTVVITVQQEWPERVHAV